jgi:hypothetical protein
MSCQQVFEEESPTHRLIQKGIPHMRWAGVPSGHRFTKGMTGNFHTQDRCLN